MLGQVVLILFIFGPPFCIYFLVRKLNKMGDPKKSLKISLLSIAVLTGLYLFWESRATGNIRIDLLVLYPSLFATYAILLWRHLKWLTLVPASLLMLLNFWFMTHSYHWFHKFPG